MSNYTMGNGRVVTDAERESLTGTSRNKDGKIDLVLAANNVAHWIGKDSICFQALQPDKGFWRFWTGTHWAIYDEAVLWQDVHWLFSGELLARQVKELVATLRVIFAVPHGIFDKKAITVFKNAVLEVVEGKIRKYELGHRPSDRITIEVPIKISQKTPTPKWDAMLERVLPDPVDRQCWMELVGYCLFPSVQLQTFFCCLGDAGTGKSTLLAILADMLGRGVTSVPLARLSDSHATAGLLGSLVNYDTEAEFLDIRGEAILKALSGNDPILINPKYQPAFSVVLPTKVIIASNDLPRFTDKSQGLWSRMVQLPFLKQIPKDERRPIAQLVAELREEHGGVAAEAILALGEVLGRGTRATAFSQSETARAQVDEHRAFSSPFEEFFAETFVPSAEAAVEKGHAYDLYKRWCLDNGYKALAANSFGKQMLRKEGVGEVRPRSEKGTRVRCYTGVSLVVQPKPGPWSEV